LYRNKILPVKNTIKHWIESKNFPKEFQEFFSKWILLNLYYNEISRKRKEIYRVLDFGRRHENLFDRVKDDAVELAKIECVGEGLGVSPPNRWVKTATLQLRKKLRMDIKSACVACRSEKRQRCLGVKAEKYEFGRMEALMRILYQIRCNLFHGGKTEHEEFHLERNKILIRTGNHILENILYSLIED